MDGDVFNCTSNSGSVYLHFFDDLRTKVETFPGSGAMVHLYHNGKLYAHAYTRHPWLAHAAADDWRNGQGLHRSLQWFAGPELIEAGRR